MRHRDTDAAPLAAPRADARLVVLMVLLCGIACTTAYRPRWTVNRAVPGPAPSTWELPPETLRDNVATTAVTALVYIERVAVTGPRGTAPPARGYVNHRYEARVLEAIRGTLPERITYDVMADADSRPALPAYPIIVSLCGTVAEGYYVPDNGYTAPATPGLVKLARQAARKPAAASICQDE